MLIKMLKNTGNWICDRAGTNHFSKEKKTFKKLDLEYPFANRKEYNDFLSKTKNPQFSHTAYDKLRVEMNGVAKERSLEINATNESNDCP